MNGIMKISQALKNSNILLKRVTKPIENETKEQKIWFSRMLFGTLGASLLGNMLTGKGKLGAGYGNKEGKGIVRAGPGSSIKIFFDSIQSFNKFWNAKMLSKWFIGVYSRDNFLKTIKDRTYRVEHVPKEIEKFIGHQNTKTNNLIMWILLHWSYLFYVCRLNVDWF